MKKYKKLFIVILLFILISIIIKNINVTNSLKVEIGSQVNREKDIVLGLISTDIVDIVNNQEEITEEQFGLITGELREAIFLHMMPVELQSYVIYLEEEFDEYKELYQRSVDKNSSELNKLKQDLLETCYKGKELHHLLSKYIDYNKKYKIWYKIYKDENHELRKLMVDMLGEERVSCRLSCK